jgi:uncharacterized membrane protein
MRRPQLRTRRSPNFTRTPRAAHNTHQFLNKPVASIHDFIYLIIRLLMQNCVKFMTLARNFNRIGPTSGANWILVNLCCYLVCSSCFAVEMKLEFSVHAIGDIET